ncbi:MAG: hypothetical protein IPN47_16045, partial [Gemmatimonadetes bacterium]|nr:hypothetical protein [Gemmatimonadota bacterium]
MLLKPVIHPTNADRVWIGVTVYRSEDGGRTFRSSTGPHVDVGLKGAHVAFWLNPKDSRHAFLGGDGGLQKRGTWGDLGAVELPIGQFYSVAADDRDPYWIYGGMQDNHSWMGPKCRAPLVRHRQRGLAADRLRGRDVPAPRPLQQAVGLHREPRTLGIQRFDIETGGPARPQAVP